MFVKKTLVKFREAYFKKKRSKYFKHLKLTIPEDFSIISNNCLAGFIYQDLNRNYSSPTAGLYFFFPDYIKFLLNIRMYLHLPLEFVNNSKYELGNQRIKKAKNKYPIALLGGEIEIHFLHYNSNEEAKDKWERRAARVNFDKLLILGTELDGCTEKDIQAFENLPFNNKYFLVKQNHDLNSTIKLNGFDKNPKLGDPLRNGDIIYKALASKLDLRNF